MLESASEQLNSIPESQLNLTAYLTNMSFIRRLTSITVRNQTSQKFLLIAAVSSLVLLSCSGGGGGSQGDQSGDGSEIASSSGNIAEGFLCDTADAVRQTAENIELTCQLMGDGKLVWRPVGGGEAGDGCGANSAQSFTASPFKSSDISMITNGNETNDARFAYVSVKAPFTKIPLYAPADGVLTAIRHLTATKFFPSDDFQLVFNLSTTCSDYWRFNHVTDPRADIRAAYSYGDKCSSCFDDNGNPTARYEEYEKPGTAIKVKAGELIGYTSGTPTAHNFDFVIQISEKTVCPMSVLAEPHKSTLLAMLGPGPRSAQPSSVPQPGYPCEGYGAGG